MPQRSNAQQPSIGTDLITEALHPVFLMSRLLVLSSLVEGFALTAQDARSIGTCIIQAKSRLDDLFKKEE